MREGMQPVTCDVDVVVAGAGPVGLSLAAALTLAGVRVVVLEAGNDLSTEARASTFHPPTLEMFADWGVADALIARGKKIDRLQFWERASRELIADFNYRLIANDTTYPFRLQCPQSVATRLLLPVVAARGGDVRFSHRVSGFEDRGNAVDVFAETPHGRERITAKWFVGADGAKSVVRTNLGLTFLGKTYEDRFLLAATDLKLEPIFPGMGPVAYVFDPQEWVIVMHLPDVVRLVFRMAPEDDVADTLREESVRARIERFASGGPAFNIKSISSYHVHQRVANRFRVGRIVLAGDAAHVNNPTGGMGMNSGIHDAHRLARALVTAIRSGDAADVERYAEERRFIAVERVQADSDRGYGALVIADRNAREARNRELREAARDEEKARQYLLRSAMLEDRIKGASVA